MRIFISILFLLSPLFTHAAQKKGVQSFTFHMTYGSKISEMHMKKSKNKTLLEFKDNQGKSINRSANIDVFKTISQRLNKLKKKKINIKNCYRKNIKVTAYRKVKNKPVVKDEWATCLGHNNKPSSQLTKIANDLALVFEI